MGFALTAQPEFWAHVAELRDRPDRLRAIARRYIRRDQAGRLEVVATYLERGSQAEPSESSVKLAVWSTGLRAWFVDGVVEPDRPQRNLRKDAIETIAIGAIRVARRGAGRCARAECSIEHGQPLANHHSSDYCASCDRMVTRPREREEAERALFAALIPAVLGGVSAPRERRRRRISQS